MKMSQLKRDLLNIKKGEHRVIYKDENGVKTTIQHTGKFSEKDFAVGLIINNKPEFNPTHVRLLIDLYIKRESNPKDFEKLFVAFDKMFKGKDVEKLALEVRKLKFPMKLDSPETNLYYTQLLMIEQDINYGLDSVKPSKCKPPRDYLMRFIRWIASGDSTIDRIISAAARNYPAPVKYANKDDSIS